MLPVGNIMGNMETTSRTRLIAQRPFMYNDCTNVYRRFMKDVHNI